ncbi:MAG TPA: conserved phage C-terminal domain-containing protein [Terriglobales bacterium]|nr:conserved phage C-terminal domain-containing protein [Terriglobales bacterium]
MSRGLYRGVYTSLVDDPDFQALTPNAKLVFYTARLCQQAGPAAIYRYYSEMLVRQTGLTARQVELALQELERDLWIMREGAILWVRNGLRHDPTTTLANTNHRKAVIRWLDGLPRLSIVAKFAEYYGLPKPIGCPSEGHSDHRIPSPSPSPIPSPSPTETLSGSAPDPAHVNGNGSTKPNYREQAREVLVWLNEKAGKHFEVIPTNLELIEARLREGRPVWLLKKLVSVKAKAWPKGHEMHEYLRPATLFNRTKCAQYVGELPAAEVGDGRE